jgi:hypothetical protein
MRPSRRQFDAMKTRTRGGVASLRLARRSLRTAVLRGLFSWRRRMRSSARSITKSSSLFACSGLPASQWSNGSLIAFSTMRVASAVARRSLVWPWNSGSRMNTESIAPAPIITSSLVMAAARLPWPTRSAWSLRPFDSAPRKPDS